MNRPTTSSPTTNSSSSNSKGNTTLQTSSFSSDLQTFIHDTEASARKIMQSSNIKRISSLQKQKKLDAANKSKSKNAAFGKENNFMMNTSTNANATNSSLSMMRVTKQSPYNNTSNLDTTANARTVNLQFPHSSSPSHSPSPSNNEYNSTNLLSFNPTTELTNASTLIATKGDRSTESIVTSGIMGLETKIDASLIKSDTALMETSYRRPNTSSFVNRGQNGRFDNGRGGVTTASRVSGNLLIQTTNNVKRPSTVGGNGSGSDSPARGAPRMVIAKLAMAKLKAELREKSTTYNGSSSDKPPRKTLHKPLEKHVYNQNLRTTLPPSSSKSTKSQEAWGKPLPKSPQNSTSIDNESTGCTSWSSDGIRIKWRGENERGQAYAVSQSSIKSALDLQDEGDEGTAVPTVEICRHPVHEMYCEMIEKENKMAKKRGFTRANNRRFNIDVHTVWLTNLNHLLEHKGLEDKNSSSVQRKRGIDDARDTENIKMARSQIQSVTYSRAVKPSVDFRRQFENRERVWKAEFDSKPKDPPKVLERSEIKSTFLLLVDNERIDIKGCESKMIYASVHKITRMKREYFETAAVLINGRWEVPESGGAEKLVPGTSANMSDDILKLSPMKVRANAEKEAREDFYYVPSSSSPSSPTSCSSSSSPLVDEVIDLRIGRTLESMKDCDVWVRANGRGFEDIETETEWRLTLYDKINGDSKTVVFDERDILERYQHLPVSVPSIASNTASTLVYRQGRRIVCGPRQLNTLISVAVVKGEEPDKSLYIDITATVSVPGDSSIIVSKRLDTYEARERLKICKFAPSRDYEWWTDEKGEDGEKVEMVWKPLVDQLLLFPQILEVEDGDSESKSKKAKRSNAPPPRPLPLPGAIDFAQSPSQSTIFSTIRSAYDLLDSVELQDDGIVAVAASAAAPLSKKIPTKIDGPLSKNETVIRIGNLDNKLHHDNEGAGWEFEADNGESLSIQISGVDPFKTLLPGIINLGKLEPLTFGSKPLVSNRTFDKARTQAALAIHRDAKTSSHMATVQATALLAFDTPLYAPYSMSWEREDILHAASVHEVIDNIIPQNTNYPIALMADKLQTSLTTQVGAIVYIMNAAEVELDYGGNAELHLVDKFDTEENVIGTNDLGFPIKEVKRTLKARNMNRRRMPFVAVSGFRQNVMSTSKELLRPLLDTPAAIFGITAKGATSNVGGVNGRTMWHSEEICAQILCRQRTPLDYRYMMITTNGSGYFDPRSFTLLLAGYHVEEMVAINSKVYGKMCDRIARRVATKAKLDALQDRIQQAEENLKKNHYEKDRRDQMHSQKTAQHKQRFGDDSGKQPTAMATDAWLDRRAASTLVEERGGWEKRRLDDGGAVFYFKHLYGIEGGEFEGLWDQPKDFEVDKSDDILPGMMVENGIFDDEDEGDGGKDSAEDKRLKETAKVALLAKMIAEDEHLLSVLCSKLGILSRKDKGDLLDLNVRLQQKDSADMKRFKGRSVELSEDDNAWSDSDDEAGIQDDNDSGGYGDVLNGMPLPQNPGDVARLLKERKAESDAEGSRYGSAVPKPNSVPSLNLNSTTSNNEEEELLEESNLIEKHVKGKGWRRLQKANFKPTFWAKMSKASCVGSSQVGIINRPSPIKQPVMIDPAKVVSHKTDFSSVHRFESLFIRDVVGDQLRVVEQTEQKQDLEEQLMKSSDMTAIAANQPNNLTIADHLNRETLAAESTADDDPLHLASKAIECCRIGNLWDLENVLDRGITDVNTVDPYGNSLLHLCCQQGNKKMVKFLLRRGANIKTQNLEGLSVLHHCHVYSHFDLAEYLREKGADDSLLSALGVTCYEMNNLEDE